MHRFILLSRPSIRLARPAVLLSLTAILVAPRLTAQQTAPAAAVPATASIGAKSPEALARLVLDRFAAGSAAAFDSVDPDPAGRAVVARAVAAKATRQAGVGRVLWRGRRRAVLLLTGLVHAGDPGEETTASRRFSGLYEASDSAGTWTLARQLPFDSANHILSHAIHARIVPAREIDVTDTLGIVIGNPYGFAVRLNHAAHLTSVRLDGRAAKYAFSGGVLWLDTPPRANARLALTYTLVARPAAGAKAAIADSAPEPPAYGEFRNDYVWHPIFDFDSPNDIARMAITVRIPAAYYLTISLPQTETVANGVRIVRGHSIEPEFVLTLLYDRDWRPETTSIGALRFETFLTPDFHPSRDSLEAVVRRMYELLGSRFGAPQTPYLGIAEERDIPPSGFRYRTNDLVVSGRSGPERLSSLGEIPQAALAHEVAHGWTMNASGPAANFLREGWAEFCEWMYLGDHYSAEAERGAWETLRNAYLIGRHEGRESILGNPENGSIHYAKGAWIFHMLESVMGDSAFDRGMRAYMAVPQGHSAGYQEFIAALSQAAGRDMTSFVMPWLAGKYIPDLDARVDGQRVIVSQTQPGPVFDLPLDLALTIDSGRTVERSMHLTHRADTLDVTGLGTITRVHIDPEHRFLIQRHFGEMVRFELRAPDAKTVALTGNFTLKPIPATRAGDVWSIELPMNEGRYVWAWQVDGKIPPDVGDPASDGSGDTARSGVRIVRPVERVTGAYPK